MRHNQKSTSSTLRSAWDLAAPVNGRSNSGERSSILTLQCCSSHVFVHKSDATQEEPLPDSRPRISPSDPSRYLPHALGGQPSRQHANGDLNRSYLAGDHEGSERSRQSSLRGVLAANLHVGCETRNDPVTQSILTGPPSLPPVPRREVLCREHGRAGSTTEGSSRVAQQADSSGAQLNENTSTSSQSTLVSGPCPPGTAPRRLWPLSPPHQVYRTAPCEVGVFFSRLSKGHCSQDYFYKIEAPHSPSISQGDNVPVDIAFWETFRSVLAERCSVLPIAPSSSPLRGYIQSCCVRFHISISGNQTLTKV